MNFSIKGVLSKKKISDRIVKEKLKSLGQIHRNFDDILEETFLTIRKKCPYRKRTKWSFQKDSCKGSPDVLVGNIGPCVYTKCPLIKTGRNYY